MYIPFANNTPPHNQNHKSQNHKALWLLLVLLGCAAIFAHDGAEAAGAGLAVVEEAAVLSELAVAADDFASLAEASAVADGEAEADVQSEGQTRREGCWDPCETCICV